MATVHDKFLAAIADETSGKPARQTAYPALLGLGEVSARIYAISTSHESHFYSPPLFPCLSDVQCGAPIRSMNGVFLQLRTSQSASQPGGDCVLDDVQGHMHLWGVHSPS